MCAHIPPVLLRLHRKKIMAFQKAEHNEYNLPSEFHWSGHIPFFPSGKSDLPRTRNHTGFRFYHIDTKGHRYPEKFLSLFPFFPPSEVFLHLLRCPSSFYFHPRYRHPRCKQKDWHMYFLFRFWAAHGPFLPCPPDSLQVHRLSALQQPVPLWNFLQQDLKSFPDGQEFLHVRNLPQDTPADLFLPKAVHIPLSEHFLRSNLSEPPWSLKVSHKF